MELTKIQSAGYNITFIAQPGENGPRVLWDMRSPISAVRAIITNAYGSAVFDALSAYATANPTEVPYILAYPLNYGELFANFTRCEYIQSTGNQYIDFGFVPTANWGLEVEIMTLSSAGNAQVIASNTDGSNNRWGIVEYPSAYWCPQWATWHSTNAALRANVWYNAKLNYDNDRKFIVDDTDVATYSTSTTPSITIKTARRSIRYRKVNFTISGVLSYRYIPCYRKSDGEIGLYDIMSGSFKTNAGSGTFLKGADV